jgi:heme exporter protein C
MKALYQLGSPKSFYQFSQYVTPPLGSLTILALTIAWVWGLIYAPADYQQGESVRIMYLHVPAAFLSLAIYAFMSICALMTMVWEIKLAAILHRSCAQVGFLFTFLALITGSLWGKPTWGVFWIWDARLTGELILLLFYASLLGLSSTMGDNKAAYKIVALVTWIGLIDLPIIHYSVQWWNTLHQGSSLLVLAKPKIHITMLWPLLWSLFGSTCFAMWSILSLTQINLLKKESRQQWVKEIFGGAS